MMCFVCVCVKKLGSYLILNMFAPSFITSCSTSLLLRLVTGAGCSSGDSGGSFSSLLSLTMIVSDSRALLMIHFTDSGSSSLDNAMALDGLGLAFWLSVTKF